MTKLSPRGFHLAQTVKTDSLEPVQQKTPRSFQIACDFRQQVMQKHPFLSYFHSRAKHLHAGLLEGDPNVISYVPRPFQLRIGCQRYIPDCYVLKSSERPKIIEIKSQKEIEKMGDDLQKPLEAFFSREGLIFEVISNESIYEREIEAENWLEIVRNLKIAETLTTRVAEDALLEKLRFEQALQLSDLVDPGDRESSYETEIALLRLLHKGLLEADLTNNRLGWSTKVRLCE